VKLEKRQISVLDLKLGMHVSELDRPWIETPFLIQGFLLRDDQEIQQLRNLCKYVYIDELQSKVEALPRVAQLLTCPHQQNPGLILSRP
jgi:hypothetical protein